MPLRTIQRTQVTFFGRPLIPNTDPIFAQPLSIGVAAQKPDQLVDDAFKMHPLGGQDGKPCREVESQLTPEDRAGARASAVTAVYSAVADIFE